MAPETKKLSFSFILINLNLNSHMDIPDTVMDASAPDQGEDGVPSIVKKEERKNKERTKGKERKRKKHGALWGMLWTSC